jgi:membrane-associated phospholipid phosphatase
MRLGLVVALAIAVLAPRAARAEEESSPPQRDAPRTLTWEWGRAGPVNVLVTGAAAATALGLTIAQPQPSHRTGPVLFDEGARDALRLSTMEARFAARDISDVFLSLSATWPSFVDAGLTAGWYRKSRDVAIQMVAINAETFAIAAAVHGVTNVVVSRERPYGSDCGGEVPGDARACVGPQRYRSFFSGHATITFTSAGLTCWHHMKLRLLGGPADYLACASSYALAGATALLRVMGDVHYASDVLTGSLMGTAIGLIVPGIHYGRRIKPATAGVQWNVVPAAGGVGVTGVF